MVSDTPKYRIKPVYACTTMHRELSSHLTNHLVRLENGIHPFSAELILNLDAHVKNIILT